MAIVRTVLPRLGLIQPQHGLAQYEGDQDGNWLYLDTNAVITTDPRLTVPTYLQCTAGALLVLNIAAAPAFYKGSDVSYAGGTLNMTASATNYVYLDPTASLAPAVNTTGFLLGQIPLAVVVTGSTAITSVTDKRPFGFLSNYPDYPKVQATATLTAQTTTQTGNLRPVSGGAAPAGYYRVTVYMRITTANASGLLLDVSIGWTDPTAARTASNGSNGMPADIAATSQTMAQGSAIVQADGVHDVTYTFTPTNTSGTFTYAAEVMMERLG